MYLIAILATAAAAVAGLAFANNVAAVYGWWTEFLAAGGKSAAVAGAVRGLVPWLDWSAVDYSAVTTFIPFWGLARVAAGCWRIALRRPAEPAHFPFTPHTDKMNVALGLFGTLWGIIVIGFHDLDTVTMADLMQCLHTALFSTLTAVVWVYMVDHPIIRPAMRRLLLNRGRPVPGKSDVAAAVELLVMRMREASGEVRRMAEDSRAALASVQEMHEAERVRHAAALKELEEKYARAERELDERWRKAFERAEAEHARAKAELERRNETAARQIEAARRALGAE